MTWKKGQSGNPKGRPVSEARKYHYSRMWEVCPEITEIIIDEARARVPYALKICADFYSKYSPPTSHIDLPNQINLDNIKSIGSEILHKIEDNSLTFEQALLWLEAIRGYRETVLVGELAEIDKALNLRVQSLPKLPQGQSNESMQQGIDGTEKESDQSLEE